jgi:Tfp pilus assembly protein PilN
MIRINLLPREIYAKRQLEQLKMIGLLLAGVVVLAVAAFSYLQIQKEAKVDQEIGDAKRELVKYQEIDNRVRELDSARGQLSSQRSVIEQLLTGALIYPRFFEDYISLLPSEIWVTSVNTQMNAAGGLEVTANAQALSNFAIADWLTNLQTSPLCSNVKMGAISGTEESDASPALYSFTMSFSYVRKGP